MPVLNAVQIVESFWADVWVARNPEVVDRHVVDDLVITSAGKRFGQGMPSGNGYASFRREFAGLEFEVIESFQNAEGNRVASRWRVRGHDNGFLGLPSDQRPLEMTGTAVWAVSADGKLLHNWVDRSAWECYQRLTSR